jgi:hypothetical protein
MRLAIINPNIPFIPCPQVVVNKLPVAGKNKNMKIRVKKKECAKRPDQMTLFVHPNVARRRQDSSDLRHVGAGTPVGLVKGTSFL